MHRFPPLDAIRRPARPRRAREGMSIRTRILLIAAIVLLPAALALGWRLTQELQQSRDDARLTVSVLRDNAAAHVAKTLREADLLMEGEVTIQNQASVPAMTGQSRTSRNTPAFTIVAEWR